MVIPYLCFPWTWKAWPKSFWACCSWTSVDVMAGIVSAALCHIHWKVKKGVKQRDQSHFSSRNEKWNWMHLDISGLNALNCRCSFFLCLPGRYCCTARLIDWKITDQSCLQGGFDFDRRFCWEKSGYVCILQGIQWHKCAFIKCTIHERHWSCGLCTVFQFSKWAFHQTTFYMFFYYMIVERTGENTAVLQTSRNNQHKNAFVDGNIYHYFLCIFCLFTCIDERQLDLFRLL